MQTKGEYTPELEAVERLRKAAVAKATMDQGGEG
jgi:hypothetical protein